MNYKTLTPDNVRFIVVHCAATTPTMDIGVPEIRRWHLARGFFDIGYHRVIRRNGQIEEGRDLDKPGAHAIGFNQKSVAVCLVGGLAADAKTPENNFTPEQFASLRVLLKEWQKAYPNARILGHRDLPADKPIAKACPSFDVREYLREHPLVD